MTEPTQLYAQSIEALNRGDWARARGLAAELLVMAPQHAGVHFVAGVASLQLQLLQPAIDHLRRAVAINPARADYNTQLARALATGRSLREAVEAADRAMKMSPDDALTLDTLGVVYTQANAHEKAVEVFRRAAQLMPERASYRFNLATSLTFSGDMEAAKREYEACIGIDPHYWKAHLALSQLSKQSDSDNHVERLESLLPQVAGDTDGCMYLNLALAKEYEDLRQYGRSFQHLSVGKAAKGKSRAYSSARDAELFDALEAAFPIPEAATSGNASREPIFVIGMPRSGTTLVERIISSHSSVHSGGELQNFGVCLKRASGSRTPSMFDLDTISRSGRLDWNALGANYIASTRPGTGHTPHFIDKLPHNFLFAGYIARALPNARIINLRRNPIDTCLSNFRQLFALTSPYYDYSFDLLDTGRYYLMYDRLMQHWQRVLPGRILDIHYEDIVDSQEEASRRLIEFCGLPWEDQCLQFENNQAPVATASAVQVREPIYRTSMERWRRYEEHLGELIELLGDAEKTG
ncbi:MAG: sulfotransferase [Pseudoxanthomonas sp.]